LANENTGGSRDVNENKLARGIGWLSIGVGLALVAAPTPTTRGFGMGERPTLGRFLGVRDLILGAGLLRSENLAPWLHARAISDAADVVLLIVGAASSVFPRRQAMVGLTLATSLSTLSFALAQRMK